ncbi:hypothetical protein J6590_045367 [Homalodisca vitripennis]|nr:hypothetical protein J6590_045367 [Homalodisca vitripennis]
MTITTGSSTEEEDEEEWGQNRVVPTNLEPTADQRRAVPTNSEHAVDKRPQFGTGGPPLFLSEVSDRPMWVAHEEIVTLPHPVAI